MNTARGGIVDEEAVANAIIEQRISGDGCDVLSNEHSLSPEDKVLVKLAKVNHCVQITPHIGGCTVDAMNLTEEIIARKVGEQFSVEKFIKNRTDL